MALGKLSAYRALLGGRLKDRFLQAEGLDISTVPVDNPRIAYMPTDLGPDDSTNQAQ